MKLPLRIGFPWLTLIVVAFSAWLAYDLNLGGKSNGFYGSRGFPLVWYTWTDHGPRFQTYNETALMWNLVLAAAFLSWLAFAMERLRRRSLGPGTVAAMIAAAVMSLFVLLLPQDDGRLG